jgi:hypothetical protein
MNKTIRAAWAYLEPGIRLTFPLPCSKLWLEVGQGVEVHAFVLFVQLGGSLLSLSDDFFNVVIDRPGSKL